jgi:ArsR family transcriptional regulator
MANLSTSLDACRLLADGTRLRLLALLQAEELTVAELTRITELAQSTVSTHLGRLREAGWARDRREGSSVFYSLAVTELSPQVQALWSALFDPLDDPVLAADSRRLAQVLIARTGDAPWPDSVALSMSRTYFPGRSWEALTRSLLGFVSLGQVLDLASGEGAVAELIAPLAERITCVDRNARVVARGQQRLARLGNVRFVQADMHDLPFSDGSFDQAMAMSALCFSADSGALIREIYRVLRPGGTLVGITLNRHNHTRDAARFRHPQMGYDPGRLRTRLESAGFSVLTCAPTNRERRPPHFEVITLIAQRPT